MKKIIVIGGGGHAKVLISILKKLNNYSIVGYTDLNDNGVILGIKYLGNDDILEKSFKDKQVLYAAIGLGQIRNSKLRRKIVEKLKCIGYQLPTIVSPKSIINEEVEIGNGTVVMDGVIINSGAKIGNFGIINTKVSIDHDCKIGDFVHIAPGVILSGGVEIGNNVLVGTGANIIQCKKIADNSIIGAGATVIRDINKPGIYVGNPAKLLQKR